MGLSGNFKKTNVYSMRGEQKLSCLIHGPGNSPYQYKLQSDFEKKHPASSPTKEKKNNNAKNIKKKKQILWQKGSG